MKVITYCVKLREPTLATSLQGDPNSSVSFDYLPGSILRGMVIGKYLNSTSTNASDDNFRRLFLNGATRYLNGYPLDARNRPGVPVPLSWHQAKKKRSQDPIFDFAVEAPDVADPEDEDSEEEPQWQAVSDPFYTLSDAQVQLMRPARTIAVHTQRTARFGRAMPRVRVDANAQAQGKSREILTKDEITGAVYRYDALAAEQSFQAAIVCDDDADADTLLPLIEGCVHIGGSRSGGYGRAEISQVQIREPGSIENGSEDGSEDGSGRLIVTFQSDVLVRDKRGQFAVDPEVLCQILGVHLSVELKLQDAFLGTNVVGGFNRTWNLPLPQALAVRMGSVLIFQDPGCDPNVLKALETRGIGERRAEGFGQLVFNRQQRATITIADGAPLKGNSTTVIFSEPEANKLATLMTRRMLRQWMDEVLRTTANAAKLNIANPPSNAQISRLRSVLLETLRQLSPQTNTISNVRQFLKGIEERGSARRQFERSTIDNKNLLNWLKGLLPSDNTGAWTMNDHTWKNVFNLDTYERSSRIDTLGIGNVKATIDNTLRLEYVLRLIDLVLARAAKQRKEED